MHTFLFVCESEIINLESFLHACAQITRNNMHSLGVELAYKVTILPKLKCGWFWLKPSCDESYPLISEAVEERYAAVVFGDIIDKNTQKPAQKILTTWKIRGAKGVREIEGSFSSVIIDQIEGSVFLVGDPIGERTLRYYTKGKTLIASPHEVSLVATNFIPLEFDYVSAASILLARFSFRGKSLLKDVGTCHPTEYIQWHDGQIKATYDPIFNLNNRINNNPREISEHINLMIDTARINLRHFVADKPKVRFALSAGWDSRASLALGLSILDPSRIITYTRGEPNSQDAETAAQLAKIYGLEWLNHNSYQPTAEEFLLHCDLLAFATNGDQNCKRALVRPLPEFNPNQDPHIGGYNGEHLRGYFYSDKNINSDLVLSPQKACEMIKRKFLSARLPFQFLDGDLFKGTAERLDKLTNEYTKFSTNGYDILDLFTLCETSAFMTCTKRRTFETRHWSPFTFSSLIRLGFMLPVPIGKPARFHLESIRRYMPKAYWIRVNGQFIAFQSDKALANILRKVDYKYLRLKRYMRNYLNYRQPKGEKNITQLQERNLSGNVMEAVRDLLSSDDSFSLRLFNRHELDLLFAENTFYSKQSLDILGHLIAMERWLNMIKLVKQQAQSIH